MRFCRCNGRKRLVTILFATSCVFRRVSSTKTTDTSPSTSSAVTRENNVYQSPKIFLTNRKSRSNRCLLQVTVNDRLALRGPLLLPFLAGFTGLSELDLSLDKSTIGGSSGSLLFIDDRILVQFFSCLSTHFRTLQSLRINFWRVSLDESERTLRQVGKHLRNCTGLSFLKASGLVVTDSTKKTRMEHGLIQAILANLHSLAWLCLDGVELTENQATSIGKCLRERFAGGFLEVSAKDVHVKAVKALVTSVEEGGRAEVLYAGGANCRLKITKLQKSAKNRKK